MDLRTEDLRLFIACVEAGTISAAARIVGLTQVAASRRLARLEAEIGTAVLHRTTRALRVTTAGNRLLDAAREIVGVVEEFERTMLVSSRQVRGEIRVSAPVLLGQMLGADIALVLSREHPALRLSFLLSNDRIDLIRDRVDLALRVGPLPDATLIARRLATADLAVYGARSVLGEAKVSRPEQLRRHAWIGAPADARLEARNSKGRSWRATLSLSFTSDDRRVLRDAAARGLGLVVLPTFLGEPDDRLERVLPAWTFGSVPLHAVWLPEARDDPRIHAVVSSCLQWMATQPGWTTGARSKT